MNIKDPDVRLALETLVDEFENLEETIGESAELAHILQEENDGLRIQVETLMKRIEELEEALAEAYLTSEKEFDE